MDDIAGYMDKEPHDDQSMGGQSKLVGLVDSDDGIVVQ